MGDAVVYLHLSDQAVAGTEHGLARVEDLGPALTSQVREWLGHRNVIVKPIIDLNNTRPVDGYEVPDWLEEAVDLRNPADCFPWSTNTTTHSRPRRRSRGDTDHTTPFRPPDRGGPPGQTALPRLGRLLRFHHRIKTHGHWKVIQLVSGVWLWHSPHGYGYLVDNTGTTPLGRLFAGD
jgi:hypothetical protein